MSSALKKFAPRHRVHVVESFAEAEAKAAEAQPQLFIADFDPPRPDAVAFLGRISVLHPSARFLAIASEVPREMNAVRYGPNALQFIDKPFELAEFGAAVQALLGPWTHPSSGDSRGALRDLSPRDFVPLQCLNLATAILHLRSADHRVGEIHFLDGQITHAATGNFTGADALSRMMRWKNPHAQETERPADAPRTLHGPWAHTFLQALRDTSDIPAEVSAESPRVEVESAAPAKPQPKTGKKIVVIDDTEMLLIFVEDILATADPTFRITTAFTGSEGIRRAEVTLPDLVLLDYSLPDLRGDQVCERLLQNEATARVPVVMMSGHVSEMAATARKYRNVVATIPKPFMSEALVALVQETLAKGPLPTRPAPETARPPVPRQGNGKKPVKKNGATAAQELPKKPLPEAPRPPVVREPVPPPSVVVVPPKPAPLPRVPAIPPPSAAPSSVSPPPLPVTPVAKPVAPAPPPPVKPVAAAPPRAVAQPAHTPSPGSPLAAANGSTVVLALGMEVLAMQFTARFQIGAIRAKPTASTLSLAHSLARIDNLLAGFEIDSVELDPQGRIQLMRVVPTRQPANAIQPRNALAINRVALVNQTAPIELTAGQAAPMTMQLIALFKVAAVELSDRFEVAQLVLRPAHGRVRLSLDPQARIAAGTEFEATQVKLDSSRRILEFVLNAAPI
ncbi:MAG TPA: response regulator [Chthoniobacterales bacterium]|nr:response regulator [Chthoniobacterales bacterium]